MLSLFHSLSHTQTITFTLFFLIYTKKLLVSHIQIKHTQILTYYTLLDNVEPLIVLWLSLKASL